jgi:hypothetical protein
MSGLGTSTFTDAVQSALDIYDLFQRHITGGKLEDWRPGRYRGHLALDMSNRYLTPKKDAPSMEHIQFDELVDPRGILEEMAQSGYTHGEDNIVGYYIRHQDEGGETW